MVDESGAMLLPADEPPKNPWVDVHDILANPTDEELEAGRVAGESVNYGESEDDFSLRVTSQSKALDLARALRLHLLSYGVPEVSIELLQGRPTSLNPTRWYNSLFMANFGHHIVSRWSSTNLTPVYQLVRNGRTDVPGPLANVYGGYDLCIRIICCGLANHPGAGGPVRLSRNGFTIPRDSARPYTWGTEWEGGLSYEDWTRVLTNPRNGRRMTMLELMGRYDAAVNTFKGWPKGEFWTQDQMEHKDPWAPSRKIDRLRLTRKQWQDNSRKYTKTTPPPPPPPPPVPLPEEDDMSQLFIDTEEWTPFLIVPKDGKPAILHLGLGNQAAGPVDIHLVYAGPPNPNLYNGKPTYVGGRDYKGWNPDINGRFTVPAGTEIVNIKVVGLKGRKLAVALTR